MSRTMYALGGALAVLAFSATVASAGSTVTVNAAVPNVKVDPSKLKSRLDYSKGIEPHWNSQGIHTQIGAGK